MSWQSWLARGVGYGLAPFTGGASIPIGEAAAQGINASQGVNKAVDQQGAAVANAQQQLAQAGQTAGNVLNQQRADFQSFANVPFQTLAQLSGVSIPNVQPMALPQQGGTLASLAQPSGMQPPAGYDPQPRLRPEDAEILGRAVPRVSAQQRTASGYQRGA